MSDYEYDDVALERLVDMIGYAVDALKRTPKGELEPIRDDILEAAELIIPAAEYVETFEAAEEEPPTAMFRSAA